MNKKRREAIAANQISDIRSFSLGGYQQKVLIEGRAKDLPVLLFLHGGPGSPVPFSVGCRGMFPQFTDKAIMVYWDQLGCGINNHIIDDTFSIDSFVNMTTDLIMALKKDFPDNPLFIFGTSWGSVLAALAALKLPELIEGVLVYGQVLTKMLFNDEVFSVLQDLRLSPKVSAQLDALRRKADYEMEDVRLMTKLIHKHTDGYQCKAGGKLPIGSVIRGMLTSPDYSLKDFMGIVKNGYMKNKSIFHELLALDLRNALNEVQIPYRILQGSTDIVTSTKTVSAFIEESVNEHLSLCILPN